MIPINLAMYYYYTVWSTAVLIASLSCSSKPKVRALRAVHLIGGTVIQRVSTWCNMWEGGKRRMRPKGKRRMRPKVSQFTDSHTEHTLNMWQVYLTRKHAIHGRKMRGVYKHCEGHPAVTKTSHTHLLNHRGDSDCIITEVTLTALWPDNASPPNACAVTFWGLERYLRLTVSAL